MKNLLLGLFTLAILAGCSREDHDLASSHRDQELFRINVDHSTRSGDDTTPLPSRFIMELYLLEDGETIVDGEYVDRYESDNGSFFVNLDEDCEYAALFWADFESFDDTDHIYNVDDLKCVIIDGQPTSEAFSGSVYFKYESQSSDKPYLRLTLTHSVAKINFIQKYNFEGDDNSLLITLPESYSLNVSDSSINEILTNGESTPTSLTFTGIEMNSADKCIGTSYIFASEESQTIMNITTKLNDESERNISNIPFQRNYIVNIKGNYSVTSSENFIIDVGNDWNESTPNPDPDPDPAPNPDNDSDTDDGAQSSGDTDEVANCYMLHPAEYQTYYIPVDERINDFWTNYAQGIDASEYTIDAMSQNIKSEILWYDTESIQGISVKLITAEDGDFTNNIGGVTAASAPNFITSGAEVAMKVTLTDNFNPGNVIVAVKRGDIILWSWHLWITDYNPDAIAASNKASQNKYSYNVNELTGSIHRYIDEEGTLLWGVGGAYETKFIMDRNLGATTDKYISSYGSGTLFYQYGRKDPFPGMSGKRYDTGSQFSPEYTPEQRDFVYAVNNPMSYITPSGNWCNDSGTGNSATIWNDVKVSTESSVGKSIFDPSPIGWRLPVNGTWSSFNGSTTSNDTFDKNIVYSLSGALYPYTGFRNNSYNMCLDSDNSSIIGSANLANSSNFYAFNIDSDDEDVEPSTLIGFSKGVVLRAVQE